MKRVSSGNGSAPVDGASRPPNASASKDAIPPHLGSEITTLEIGGPCPGFVHVRNGRELAEVIRSDRRNRSAFTDRQAICIGGGSNLLISDAGFDGLLLQFRDDQANAQIDQKSGRVIANAAMPWDRLVEQCTAAGLRGLECISGVPGTVGGAIVQNAGAYGQEVSDSIFQVTLFNTVQSNTHNLKQRQMHFGYRTSTLKRSRPGRLIVTAAVFQLQPGHPYLPTHAELQSRLKAEHGPGAYSLEQIRKCVLEVRRDKGMLVESQLEPSAGSFFVNPEMSKSDYHHLIELHPELQSVPRTAVTKGRYGKLPGRSGFRLAAAAMIEAAGFNKGYQVGMSAISSRHSLALVNKGHATSEDITDLTA